MRSLLGALLATTFLLPGRADACENAVRPQVDPDVSLLYNIELALSEGDHAFVEAEARDVEDERLQQRLNVAVTTARMRWRGRIADALETFPDYLERTPDDVVLQARLAEARSRGTAEQRKVARITLEALAAKDLLAEPEAWAALARLRAADRDAKGAVAAAARCRKMTQRKGVCPKM